MTEDKTLATYEPSAKNLADLAQHFIRSGYFKDATDVSKAVVKILAGQEVGVGPLTAMTGINVIEGRITMSANLIAAQIKRSGRYNYRIKIHTDQACVLEFLEGGRVVGESGFTMEDAKRIKRRGVALIDGDNWRNYPRNMLFARAVSNGARWYCPDVFGGAVVYTPEEIAAPEESPRASSPTVVEQTTGEAPEASQTASSEATPKVYGKAQLTKEQLVANAPKVENAALLLSKADEYFGMGKEAVITEIGPLAEVKSWPDAWIQIVEIKA